MRRLAQEWDVTGLWLLAVGVAAALLLRRTTVPAVFVAAPLFLAAGAACWVGRTFSDRTARERRLAGRIVAWSIAGSALTAAVFVASGAI